MIVIDFDTMLEQRERTLYWLAQETGVAYSTLWKLKNAEEPKSMGFTVLDRVCEKLECEPGDIIKRVSAVEAKKRAGKGKTKKQAKKSLSPAED